MRKEIKTENYKIWFYKGRKKVYWVELYEYPVERFTKQLEKGQLMFHNKDKGAIEIVNLDNYDVIEIHIA